MVFLLNDNRKIALYAPVISTCRIIIEIPYNLLNAQRYSTCMKFHSIKKQKDFAVIQWQIIQYTYKAYFDQ